MHYFFFGTLMDPDLIEAVLGRRLPSTTFASAELSGYCAVAVASEDYPVLVAKPGGVVKGVVVHDLGVEDARRIAFFEESEYAVATHRIRLADSGQSVDAAVHLNTSLEAYHDVNWDFETWRRIDKPLVLALSRQWMRHYGSGDMVAAEIEWCATRAAWLAGDARRRVQSR